MVRSDDMMEDLSSFTAGPSLRVINSQERAAASGLSKGVYAGCIERDEHFAYALGVIWLAFGFALALSAQKRQ